MELSVRKVGVFSLAKIMGAIYGLFGLIFGAIMSLVSLIGGLGVLAEGGEDGALAIFFGIGAIIVLPILYGVMGVLLGLLTGLIFNLVSGITGGLELEVDGLPAAVTTAVPPSSPILP